MGSGDWGVLLFERPSKAYLLADRVVQALRIPRYEVMRGLRDQRNYILEWLDRASAERVAGLLVAGGVAAVARPRASLEVAFGAGVLRAARFCEEAVYVRAAGAGEETRLSWGVLRAVFALHRERRGREEVAAPALAPGVEEGALELLAPVPVAGGTVSLLEAVAGILADFIVLAGGEGEERLPPPLPARREPATEASGGHALRGGSEDLLLMVMGRRPAVVSVVERSRFDYRYLGARAGPSSRRNFLQVVADLARFGRPLYVNRDVVEMLGGRSDRPRERVEGRFLERWLRERLLMLDVLEDGALPPQARAVMDEEESILFYLE